MQFPPDMDAKSQSLIKALAFRFAKNKPGLEVDDLINEAFYKYATIKEHYDPNNKACAAFTTLLYKTVRNHFLNLQGHYLTALTTSPIENIPIKDPSAEFLHAPIEEYLELLQKELIEPTSKLVLKKLIAYATEKTTIKSICDDLNISFFKYQQAEFKIRHAIKNIKS